MAVKTVDKDATLRELEAVFEVRGLVPTALVRELAEDLGCTERTVWNWWQSYRSQSGLIPPEEPSAGKLTQTQMEVLFATEGNVSRAYRELVSDEDAAADTPSRRTLARWWSQVDAPVRAFASEGATGLMNQQLRVRNTVDERNQLWRIDHQEFPVWVLPAGHRSTPVKPWVTTIIDDATRYLLSVLVTVERPDATSVTVALADAMRLKPTNDPSVQVGGIPLAFYTDNGGELRSEQVLGMLKRLGVASRRSFPYMKHLNGKVERVQQTMQDELGQLLPGYADGPQTLKLRDLYGLDAELMTEHLFVELVCDWVDTYNTEREHQSLDGQTPLQAWSAKPTPLRTAPDDEIRRAMMPASKPRKVTADGISLSGQLYTSAELARQKLIGRQVDVRYWPHDDSHIEVFDGDTWLATAVKVNELDEDGRRLLAEVNREQYRTARSFVEAARERRQIAIATATADKPARVPLSAASPNPLGDGDEDLMALSEIAATPQTASINGATSPAPGTSDSDDTEEQL